MEPAIYTTKTLEQTPPAPAGGPIDRGHLTHATFGDRSLEREVLQLFDRQAVLLLARIKASEPQAVAGLVHTLKGSAVGIGAWAVAGAAEAAEQACAASAAECDAAVLRLAAAIAEARGAIVELLDAA
jgi:HPt (histidine-containing phosphotransfer) domain-containing protein